MKLSYNAPVSLTFSLIAVVVFLLGETLVPSIMIEVFSIGPGMNAGNFMDWIKLFTHVLGHANWDHILGNLTFILLLGPILEEKYGKSLLAIMILVTALVTGIIHVLLSGAGIVSYSALLGASGIVFMMILLASFANFKNGEVPISFILVAILFLLREFFGSGEGNISHLSHILGGSLGSVFGFLQPQKKNP